jgi:glycosyltransferase involved in cell wall biosynthesis
MNILLIRPVLEPGGVVRSLLQLAQGLSQAGHHVTIATQSWQWFGVANPAEFDVAHVSLYPSTAQTLFRAIPALLSIVRRRQIQIIHSHHRFSSVVGQCVSMLWGTPVVSTVHEFKHNRLWLTKFGLQQQVITYSHALKNHLMTHYHLSPDRIQVQRMGVIPAVSLVLSPEIDNHSNQTKAVMSCIARLVEEKGLEILIHALGRVRSQWGDSFCCRIIGDGPVRPKLENLAHHLGLDRQITFTGWQDNIFSYMAESRFLVLPSFSEGLGLVILEGWLLARPTIGSNVGGISELIKDHYNGLLTPPGNPEALAQSIIYLLERPQLVKQLGQAGQKEVLQNHRLDMMIAQTEQLYKTVLASKRNGIFDGIHSRYQ